MTARQRSECYGKLSDFAPRWADPDPATVLLQHVDASPPVGCIYHEMHRSVRSEHVSQSSESTVRVRKMMENPGAHNLIEARLQFVYPLDGKLVDLEIVQVVFSLEFLGMAHTCRAKIDARNLSLGPTHRMLGRLRCPAAGNKDGPVFSKRAGRPE